MQGSIEALRESLEKLGNEEVSVKVVHDSVGGISETDVMLASASNSVIVGFNVRPTTGARDAAKKENIEFGIHYPRPVHKQKAYKDLNVNELINSETCSNEIISLPLFPKMKKEEIEKVISFLNQF